MKIAERDLAACSLSGLSPDRQLSIAYNAALQAATAALTAVGFRARGPGHHETTIRSLAFTMKADPQVVLRLNAFRRRRNIVEYKRAGVTSEADVKEMIALAREIGEDVTEWLRENHPRLLRKP